jgi:hypothetical protein
MADHGKSGREEDMKMPPGNSLSSLEVESDPKGLSPERCWPNLTNQVETFSR